MDGKAYPHLSPERLQDLQSVGSTVQQLEKADENAREEIDRRLDEYNLSYRPKGRNDAGTKCRYMKLAVIGTSGAGKSATGNTLLRETTFAESTGALSETKTFLTVQSEPFTVVDTPGSWSLPSPKEHHIDMYTLIINLASPRFGKEDLENIHKLKDYNNLIKSKRCVVLLTHASDALQGKSLYEYVQEIKGDPLYELIMKDMEGWRVMAINNNCDTKYEADKQHEMMVKILQRTCAEANFNKDNICSCLGINVCYGIIITCSFLLLLVWAYVWYVGLVHRHSQPNQNSTTVEPNTTSATIEPGTSSP